MQPENRSLDPLFAPKSIAVIGASNREGSVGHAAFTNILLSEYTGTVYPVNPKEHSISGVRAYPSVLDLPETVDLAVVIVPASIVPSVVEAVRRLRWASQSKEEIQLHNGSD